MKNKEISNKNIKKDIDLPEDSSFSAVLMVIKKLHQRCLVYGWKF